MSTSRANQQNSDEDDEALTNTDLDSNKVHYHNPTMEGASPIKVEDESESRIRNHRLSQDSQNSFKRLAYDQQVRASSNKRTNKPPFAV